MPPLTKPEIERMERRYRLEADLRAMRGCAFAAVLFVVGLILLLLGVI